MFDFFDMAGNYESRKVLNDEWDGIEVDTVAITDASQPYETGIKDCRYHDSWIIVEQYDTKKQAIAGHRWWTNLFKNNPPQEISDVGDSGIGKLAKAVSNSKAYTFKRKTIK